MTKHIGTWELVRVEAVDADGAPVSPQPYGDGNFIGRVVLTADRLSSTITDARPAVPAVRRGPVPLQAAPLYEQARHVGSAADASEFAGSQLGRLQLDGGVGPGAAGALRDVGPRSVRRRRLPREAARFPPGVSRGVRAGDAVAGNNPVYRPGGTRVHSRRRRGSERIALRIRIHADVVVVVVVRALVVGAPPPGLVPAALEEIVERGFVNLRRRGGAEEPGERARGAAVVHRVRRFHLPGARRVHPQPTELLGHAEVVAQRGVSPAQTHRRGLYPQLEPRGSVKVGERDDDEDAAAVAAAHPRPR